jgi:hypothetical protein
VFAKAKETVLFHFRFGWAWRKTMTKRVTALILTGVIAAMGLWALQPASETVEMTEATQLIDHGFA